MTVGQHFLVADVTHYVRVATNTAQVITKFFFLLGCLITEWLRGEENTRNLKRGMC